MIRLGLLPNGCPRAGLKTLDVKHKGFLVVVSGIRFAQSGSRLKNAGPRRGYA